jgi:acid phosphatase type 7
MNNRLLCLRQWKRAYLLIFVLGSSLVGDPVATASAQEVLVGAGDIADCNRTQDEATARLLDNIAGTVFTAGDNTYPNGTTAELNTCYHPAWGRHKWRTRPSPGNHDYKTLGADPYYTYFGANAGPAARGYYSYDLGPWHIISLNSNVAAGAGSAQEQWLRADLAATSAACVLAYWHHALFSSGSRHGNDPRTQALFQALYDYGADVVITAHDHHYERFASQNPNGQADPTGIRVFVVGTGGAALRPIGSIQLNSEMRNVATYGVLKLTLEPTSYDWEFIPIVGQSFRDSGSAACFGSNRPQIQKVSSGHASLKPRLHAHALRPRDTSAVPPGRR